LLVLERRIGQQVVIGDDIVVTVVDISEHRIRLGFDAPREVRIDRMEVRERINNGEPRQYRPGSYRPAPDPPPDRPSPAGGPRP
jgi:carbon storage regulator CsrA